MFVTKVKRKDVYGSKERLKTMSSCSKKKQKERKEIKENCVQHTQRGLGSNKFRLVQLVFIYPLPTSCFYSRVFLSIQKLRLVFLDYYSVLHHYISAHSTYILSHQAPLTSTMSCCTVIVVTITLPLQIAATVLPLFRERKNLFCKWWGSDSTYSLSCYFCLLITNIAGDEDSCSHNVSAQEIQEMHEQMRQLMQGMQQLQ